MRRLRLPDEVVRLVRGMHPSLKRKVQAATEEILADPLAGKALRGELEGLRSYRLGRVRIVYRVATRGVVEIVAIGPRAVIYEETARLLQRPGKGQH